MKLSMINSDPKRKPSFPLSLELSFVAFQIKQNKKHLNFFIFFISLVAKFKKEIY